MGTYAAAGSPEIKTSTGPGVLMPDGGCELDVNWLVNDNGKSITFF